MGECHCNRTTGAGEIIIILPTSQKVTYSQRSSLTCLGWRIDVKILTVNLASYGSC